MAKEPFPDKLTLVCVSTEATSTSKNNSNKFHRWEKLPNGNFNHTYGRVGDDGQSHEVSESKASSKRNEALKSGYSVVATVDAGPAPVASASGAKKVDVHEQAVNEIAKGDSTIEKLVRFLAEQNIHNISSTTTMKYDVDTGLFATPLGIVTSESLDSARTLLGKIQKIVMKGDQTLDEDKNREFDKVAGEYMRLIPTNIGRDRPTFYRLFPDLDAVRKQNDIIDSLEGSLTMAMKPAKKATKAAAGPKVWDMWIKKCASQMEIERIRTKFRKTHEGSTRFDVRNVYEMEINHMSKAFQEAQLKMGNVEEMWHGTSVGNVLSIFAKGLIIPANCSNGRNFGNGIYASRQAHKSLSYAGNFRSSSRTSCYMFLVEVAMGTSFVPKSRVHDVPSGYHSMDVRPDLGWWHAHEAIVYQTKQANVVRLVEFAA